MKREQMKILLGAFLTLLFVGGRGTFSQSFPFRAYETSIPNSSYNCRSELTQKAFNDNRPPYTWCDTTKNSLTPGEFSSWNYQLSCRGTFICVPKASEVLKTPTKL